MVNDTFKTLATDWRKKDWTMAFDVLFVAIFKNRYNVSFFPVIWKYFTFQAIFEYFEKTFYYSVAGHFQYANTDQIMSFMSFIRIKFKDYFLNIILHVFNVFQVLIGNGKS